MTSGKRSSNRGGRRSATRRGPARTSARRNIRKAARVAEKRRTIANLPKKKRTALAKQANKVKRQRRSAARRA